MERYQEEYNTEKYSVLVQNAIKHYDNFELSVSINIPRGNIVGLIGENGAGKSTLLKLILGLIKREKGKIIVLGSENINLNRNLLEDVGVILDENVIPENLNINQINNVMKSIYKKWDTKKYFDLIKRFKLPLDKKIKKFSKGMKMKLSLIVSIAHNPRLLILDEPTTGLDPVAREQILDMFLEFVQDSKNSILFSSHIMADLEKVADYIIFIKNGQVLIDGKKDLLIYEWGVIKCDEINLCKIPKNSVIAVRKNDCYYDVLINNKEKARGKYEKLIIDDAFLEEIMLICINNDEEVKKRCLG